MTCQELIDAMIPHDFEGQELVAVFRDDDGVLHWIDRVMVEDGRVVLVGVTA